MALNGCNRLLRNHNDNVSDYVMFDNVMLSDYVMFEVLRYMLNIHLRMSQT